MTEFYFSRWQSIVTAVMLTLLTSVIWVLCYFLIPIDAPNISPVINHFTEGLCLFAAVVATFVTIYVGFRQLWFVIRHMPIVVITNDHLQVYDLTRKRYLIFDWQDVLEIENFTFKGSLSFDIHVREDKRYQFTEPSRWRRFMLKLDQLSLQGAAVRIPASGLNVSPRTLYNELQSHMSK